MTLLPAIILLKTRIATLLTLMRSAWCTGIGPLLIVCGPACASPAFYVGGHDPAVKGGGPQVESAMRLISTAASDEDRRVALAAEQKLADAGDAEAAFRLGRFYHLESGHPDYGLYELAARNLTDNKDLFPEDVRRQGLVHLEVIKNMIHGGAVDMHLLASGDMTY